MQRVFLLQIVHAEHPHKVARLPGGGNLELNLHTAIARQFAANLAPAIADLRRQVTADVIAEVLRGGVGVFRTEAHVQEVVASVLETVLVEKLQGLQAIVPDLLAQTLEEVFRSLKMETTNLIK